jgi:hypothetical protein
LTALLSEPLALSVSVFLICVGLKFFTAFSNWRTSSWWRVGSYTTTRPSLPFSEYLIHELDAPVFFLLSLTCIAVIALLPRKRLRIGE